MTFLSKPLLRNTRWLLCGLGLATLLSACGGAGGSDAQSGTSVGSSSGTITAFGSVFVNGHEFATNHARFIDEDTGASSITANALEVGMVVDVTPSAASSNAAPDASELRFHPLARGYVDAINTGTSTLTLMGQNVQVTASTNFSDHRACATASTPTCNSASGLGTLNPGDYVTVHGYLYSASSGTTNMVATLISASDTPVTSGNFNFKVEGPITLAGNTASIAGLALDLSSTTCRISGAVTPCSNAFSNGQIVSVGSPVAPASPVTQMAPAIARLATRVPVQAAGTSLELEGVVSSVNAGTSTLVVRGMSVDVSALATGSPLPGVGDTVEIVGTMAASGLSVTATHLKTLHVAASASLGLEGDISHIQGSSGTYSFTLLGQTVQVNATTRLTDMSVRQWDLRDPAAHPFNITTFASYLGAPGMSQHAIVRAEVDGSTGQLNAVSLTLIPAASVARASGVADAVPAVFNSSTTGTPTTFSVHGVAVSADPAAIYKPHSGAMQSLASGDWVTAVGTYSNGSLIVTATTSATNFVIDSGAPVPNAHNGMPF